jgi:hypothetical protein
MAWRGEARMANKAKERTLRRRKVGEMIIKGLGRR